jgi:hypothetical protein
VCGCFSSETPRRARQNGIAFVDALLITQWAAGMQIDRHIECLHARPKVPYGLLVEVLGGVHVTNVRIAVDHCPLETELRDGALQFVASGAHVLKRHGGEGGEPVRMCRQELLGQIIVHPLCGFDRYRAIRYALNARLRQ